MNDHQALRDYIAEITHGRRLSPTELDTLTQLLLVPRVRARFPALSEDDIRAVAGEAVSEPPRRKVRRKSA